MQIPAITQAGKKPLLTPNERTAFFYHLLAELSIGVFWGINTILGELAKRTLGASDFQVVLLVQALFVLPLAGCVLQGALQETLSPELIGTLVFWEAGILLLLAAPLYPLIGPLVGVILGYLHYGCVCPVDVDPACPFSLSLGRWATILTVLGWIGWMVRRGRWPSWPRHWLVLLAAAVVAWVGISAAWAFAHVSVHSDA